MNDLEQRIADLPPEKRALLERRLLDRMRGSGEAPETIPRRAPAETYPLSHTQRRLWFLAQWEPKSPIYNSPSAFRLRGALDADALQQSFDALVMRHESLRTTFRVVDGAPVQEIAPTAAVPSTLLDLSGLPPAERERELARALQAEGRRPFDLSRDLMLRTLLVRLGPREHVLLAVMHHIASDGFSFAILRRELSALYSARVQPRPDAGTLVGVAPALPELPIQYADFACWQSSAAQEQAMERQLAYWTSQLRGAPLELELPADHPRPAVKTDGGARLCFELPAELARSLDALSRAHSATLFMTLLAAFDVLLHRYTGLTDVLVGTPMAGRTRAELEALIGFFANTLVLRADLSGDPSFLELLQRVRKTALEAYEHQDAPFDRLVDALRPERDNRRAPLVQVAFALQNTPRSPLRLPGLEAQWMELDTGTAKFDLLLNMTQTPDGFSAWFEYSTDLFERETIARMARHLRVLLEGIAANPARRLSELPLLTQEERQRVLHDWNRTATDFPKDRCVHELFEQQAARTPEAVAVVDGQAQWTYAELDARANRLARRLQGLGITPSARVCVLAERSAEMIAAFLAILKAGAAYVPLDPAYPKERLAFMVEDAGAAAVLASPLLTERMPASKVVVVPLNENLEAAGGKKDPGVPFSLSHFLTFSRSRPGDLAYVIYTSGSTGMPKGVAVPHRAIVRLVMNTDYLRLDAASVVAQAANSSFDAATFEIWGPLLNGGRLVVVPKETLLAPGEMDALVARSGINVLFLTTALFNEYARERPSVFGRLRTALFGGEAADPRAVAEVLRRSPPGRLVHVYGPTEATTFATWHLVERVAAGARSVPMGRPIANTTAYVLDRNMNIVPVGVAGELHIGGPGVARGYLNRPELSAEKFVRDSFDERGAAASARLYKSGDLVRRLPDGNIEFLGRMDDQVKIRGFRVELGEIEMALRRHPAVKEATAAVREDVPGSKYLAAYLVTKSAEMPSAAELRAFLEAILPDYLVPATFTRMDSIPLTPNGKVDRKALPAPVRQSSLETGRTAPSDMVELELVRMWQSLLGIAHVGVRDNFFELGGHSLLAVRLLAEIEATFGKKLPLVTLFEAPTIEQLGKALRGICAHPAQGRADGQSSMTAFRTSGSGTPFFCVAPMNAFEYTQLARRLDPNRPFYVFHPAGSMDVENPDVDLQALAECYLSDLRTVQPEGPYLLGGLCVGGMIAYEMAQRLQAQGQRVALLALMDVPFPGPSRPVSRLDQLAWRVVYHAANLRRLKSKDRTQYLGQRWAALKRKFRQGAHPSRQPGSNGGPSPADDAGERFWSGLRTAYRRVMPTYAPKPYNGRTVVFLASDTPAGLFNDCRRKWRRLATGKVEVHFVPGKHFGMLQPPGVDVLAEKLRDCLQSAQQPG